MARKAGYDMLERYREPVKKFPKFKKAIDTENDKLLWFWRKVFRNERKPIADTVGIDPFEKIDRKVDRDRWLSTLGLEERLLAVLYDDLHRTYEDIGFIMGWSNKTVGNKIRRMIENRDRVI